jgi:hypothetical protein
VTTSIGEEETWTTRILHQSTYGIEAKLNPTPLIWSFFHLEKLVKFTIEKKIPKNSQ